MPEQKDFPLPDTQLPKPEEDLPLPEKEITDGKEEPNSSVLIQNKTNETPSPTPETKTEVKSHSVLIIFLLILIYPVGMILMWFMTKWPKWVKILLSLPFVLGIIGLILGLFILNQIASNDLTDKNLPPSENEQVFCAQDAKLCPDGITYVSRVGPYCEFAQCPEAQETTPEQNQNSLLPSALSTPSVTPTSTSSSNLQ